VAQVRLFDGPTRSKSLLRFYQQPNKDSTASGICAYIIRQRPALHETPDRLIRSRYWENSVDQGSITFVTFKQVYARRFAARSMVWGEKDTRHEPAASFDLIEQLRYLKFGNKRLGAAQGIAGCAHLLLPKLFRLWLEFKGRGSGAA